MLPCVHLVKGVLDGDEWRRPKLKTIAFLVNLGHFSRGKQCGHLRDNVFYREDKVLTLIHQCLGCGI